MAACNDCHVNARLYVTGWAGVWALVLGLVLHCSVVVHAELLFHRRDHRDQGEFTSNQNIFQVQTFDDALRYLTKYGYLHCDASARRTAPLTAMPDFDHLAQEGSLRRPPCADDDFKEALRKWQERYKLPATGALDEETKRTMSQGRCGNSDNDQGSRSETTVSTDAEGGSSTTPAPQRTRVRRRAVDLITRNRQARAERKKREAFYGRDRALLGSLVQPADYDQRVTLRRRQRMLDEIIEKIKSDPVASQHRNATREEYDLFRARVAQRRRRQRRSMTVVEGLHGNKFADLSRPIKYRLLSSALSGKIPVADQKGILLLAFRMWSEVIPLSFVEDDGTDVNDVDILVAFGKEWHLNCDKPFDGHGGELAHSWQLGDIHFDEDENYKRDDPSGNGINLLKVATHEIGHVLGLDHNDKDYSVMFPLYMKPTMYEDFELGWEDRKDVQQIYGVCKGMFALAIDWLRKVPDPGGAYQYRFIYNSYFFRDQRYWMYENRFNRTRYGDPLEVNREWFGLPTSIDAYTQVVIRNGFNFDITTYFFQGDMYYRYDDEEDKVVSGYPRLISEDFRGNPNSTVNESIPDNLDAVHFDSRDNRLYFFKGEWVWVYDPMRIGTAGCCERKVRFSELYRMEDTTNATEQITGNIDTVYHSYFHLSTYFFKGETIYKNIAIDQPAGQNVLQKIGPWYSIWYDICEVM